MALIFVLAVFLVGVGVRLNDGANVPLRPTEPSSAITSAEVNVESIESLAASKILMDHTSSLPQSLLLPTNPVFKVTGGISQSSNAAVASLSKILKPNIDEGNTGSEHEKSEAEEEIRSPLLVAQCRATCLDKFATTPTTTTATSSKMERENIAISTTRSRKLDQEMRLLPNLLRLNRRKKRAFGPHKFSSSSSSATAACLHKSSECLSCWKSCQLLETSSATPTPSETGNNPEGVFPSSMNPHASHSSSSPSTLSVATSPVTEEENGEGQVNLEDKVGKKEHERSRMNEGKSKHPILACSKNNNSNSKRRCMAGCQVACSFYERLLSKNGGEKIPSNEPVVATKQERVVKIVPGKITWPAPVAYSPTLSSGQKDGSSSGSVVYVVIQEYTDRKWKQIAQTTELELDIPSEMTAGMMAKLGSMRILVVGPEGLRNVYCPLDSTVVLQQKQFSTAKKVVRKSRKMAAVVAVNEQKENLAIRATTAAEAIAITTETNDYGENKNSNDANMKGNSESEVYVTQEPQEESGALPTTLTSLATDSSSSTEAPGIVVVLKQEPFELRLVSLIHQKSLVIAELRWDEIGGNPNQDYLITWELTGGGLKGHLVTDSTSVTLSLWPDTTYQIQVEQFQQNLDSDGEQPTPDDSSSLKSFPLIVDTSVASFPLVPPSALLGSKSNNNENSDEDDDFQSDEDEFAAEDEEEDDEQPGHKSIGQVLGVAFVSLVLVLGILTLVAFTWAKLQMLYAGKSCEKVDECCFSGESGASYCFSYCFNGCAAEEKDARLFASQEDLHSEDSASFYASPMHYVLSLKNSQYSGNKNKNGILERCLFGHSSHYHGKINGQQDEKPGCAVIGLPVAVISSASSFSSSTTTEEEVNSELTAPCSLFNCYYNNESQTSDLPSSSSLAPGDLTRREM